MSFFRELIEEFKRPVVAFESLDARPAPIPSETWEDEPETQPVAVGAGAEHQPPELRRGY